MTITELAKATGLARSTIYRRLAKGLSFDEAILPAKKQYSPLNVSLCWRCANYYNGCSWSRGFIPVDGSEADEHDSSYGVISCSEFISDKKRRNK